MRASRVPSIRPRLRQQPLTNADAFHAPVPPPWHARVFIRIVAVRRRRIPAAVAGGDKTESPLINERPARVRYAQALLTPFVERRVTTGGITCSLSRGTAELRSTSTVGYAARDASIGMQMPAYPRLLQQAVIGKQGVRGVMRTHNLRMPAKQSSRSAKRLSKFILFSLGTSGLRVSLPMSVGARHRRCRYSSRSRPDAVALAPPAT